MGGGFPPWRDAAASHGVAVHERIHIQALESGRPPMFENNDPAMRRLVMDGAPAGRAAYQADRRGTWELDTDTPFHEPEHEDATSPAVVIGAVDAKARALTPSPVTALPPQKEWCTTTTRWISKRCRASSTERNAWVARPVPTTTGKTVIG